MPRSALRLTLALALLAAPFGGPASAAERPASPGRGAAVWVYLAQLLPLDPLRRIGCTADPFGLCAERPAVAKIGCKADPNGLCTEQQPPVAKIGCQVDPNGRCIEDQPVARIGCQVDPYGLCLPH